MGYETSTISYTLLYPSIFFPGTTQYDESTFIPFEHRDKITRWINSIHPFTWWKTYKEIRKQKPDAIIYVWWMPFFGPALGYIAKKIYKQLPQTKNIFLVENFISHEKRWFDRYLTKRTLKYAHCFISESQHITDLLTNHFPDIKVFQSTLSVYDCYNLNRYSKIEAKNQLQIKSKHTILFFGMIRPYKGLDKLIETFVAMQNKDATLLIVGEAYENIEKYHTLIRQSNIQDQTILVNKFIANEDVEVYFKAADVLVLPYNSGTQSGILMMGYGFKIPVVVTKVGGIAELIVDRKTGIIAKDNSIEHLKPAIEEILHNKSDINYAQEISQLTQKLGYGSLKDALDYCFQEKI